MAASGGAYLRHVAIRTHDIPRTVAFYTDALGLRRLDTRTDGLGAAVGDGAVNLTIVPLLCLPDDVPPVVEGTERIHIGFVVDDLLAVFRRCQAWGATILAGDISSRDPLPPGLLPERSFKVADPNGNVIDIIADPHHWPGVTL